MSPNRRRFRLAELRAQHIEANGEHLEVETPKGKVFKLPVPGLWPDEAKIAMEARDEMGLARALIPDYAEFAAAGGRADDLGLLLKAYAEDRDMPLPESSGSSTS